MVINSLKTRIFSGLLACLFLMPVVSANPVEEVAAEVANTTVQKTVQIGAEVVQSVSPDWHTVACAWQGAGDAAGKLVKSGCHAFHSVLVSGLGYKMLEISGDAAKATCDCGTVWFNFFQKHPALLGLPLIGAAAYSGYHKIRHGTWWP